MIRPNPFNRNLTDISPYPNDDIAAWSRLPLEGEGQLAMDNKCLLLKMKVVQLTR